MPGLIDTKYGATPQDNKNLNAKNYTTQVTLRTDLAP